MGKPRALRVAVAALLVAGAAAALFLLMRAELQPDTATDPDAPPVAATTESATESAAAGVVGAAPKRDSPRRVAASSAASTAGDAKPATVVVRVTAAEDDAPIADASVFVGTIAGRTDAAGTARFEHLEACEWSFEASAPGRFKRSFRRAISADAETTIDLRLSATAVIAVRVEDRASGAPIDRAKIEVDAVGLDFKERGTTGDDGERLMSAPAGSIVRVTASAISTAYGHDACRTTVRLGGAGTTTPVVLRLLQPGRMTGVVRGPDGAVVAGATIWLRPEAIDLPEDQASQRNWDSGDVTRTATSNADGTYSAWGLVRGRRYAAFAAAESGPWAPSASVTGLVVPADGPDLVQDFALREFGNVVVRVSDANGAPVSNATVMVMEGQGFAARRRTENEPGVHRLDRRAPGPVSLFIWSQSGTIVRSVVVPSGGSVEVDVVLGTPETVKCLVVDDAGLPVSGANVATLTSVGTVAFKAELKTDESGVAPLPRFGVGIRTLTVTAPGMLPTTVSSDTGLSEDVRVVMQRAAVLTFRLVGEPGEWVGSDVCVLFGDDPRPSRTRPECDGVARIDCEPRGDVDVRLIFGLHAPVTRRATLAAGAVADLGDVRLVQARTLGGRVVDLSGRPVEGALVGIDVGGEIRTPASRKMLYDPLAHRVECRSDGRFEFEFAPPSGPLPLVVTADGFVELHTVVTVDGDAPITLTLQRGGLLWGEVVESTGGPRAGATVRVLDGRGAEVAAPIAGKHGEFDFRVAPGRYTVRVAGCGDVSVELREGGDEHVVLTERAR